MDRWYPSVAAIRPSEVHAERRMLDHQLGKLRLLLRCAGEPRSAGTPIVREERQLPG
jgi:hypothetical protein